MFDLTAFLPRAVMQGIPLLYGSTGEILTEKSGNLNLGIPGVMYVGGICGVIGAFFYEQSTPAADMNAFLAIGIPMLCSLLGSLLMGLLYCLLTVTLRANQNVTGLALTTFGVGIGNFFGGSLIKLTDSEVPSIALSATSGYFSKALPFAAKLGWFGQIFLSYVIWYGLGRSWIEGLRTDSLLIGNTGLRASQLVAIGSVIAAAILLIIGLRNAKDKQLQVTLAVSDIKKQAEAGDRFTPDTLPANALHADFVKATDEMNRRLKDLDLDAPEIEELEDPTLETTEAPKPTENATVEAEAPAEPEAQQETEPAEEAPADPEAEPAAEAQAEETAPEEK